MWMNKKVSTKHLKHTNGERMISLLDYYEDEMSRFYEKKYYDELRKSLESREYSDVTEVYELEDYRDVKKLYVEEDIEKASERLSEPGSRLLKILRWPFSGRPRFTYVIAATRLDPVAGADGGA